MVYAHWDGMGGGAAMGEERVEMEGGRQPEPAAVARSNTAARHGLTTERILESWAGSGIDVAHVLGLEDPLALTQLSTVTLAAAGKSPCLMAAGDEQPGRGG